MAIANTIALMNRAPTDVAAGRVSCYVETIGRVIRKVPTRVRRIPFPVIIRIRQMKNRRPIETAVTPTVIPFHVYMTD